MSRVFLSFPGHPTDLNCSKCFFVLAGVDPNKEYPALYRYFVEVWVFLGLAWLSLFFNWKVRMVIEAHKALKKRRKRRKLSLDELQYYKKSQKSLPPTANDVNIFSFLSKKQEGYNDLIKQIGSNKDGRTNSRVNIMNTSKVGRSKSCSDTPLFNAILSLERSPRQKRRCSFSERVTVAFSKSKNYLLGADNGLLLMETHVEGDQVNRVQAYENQLDKHVDRGVAVIDGGVECQRTSDSKEFQPINANITFVDKHFLTNNLNDDDDDSKGKLSIVTCEENIELSTSEEMSSDSEGFVFTSDCSEKSQSYDKLVQEYTKEDNTF